MNTPNTWLQKAIELAHEKHSGVDARGQATATHPMRVMERLENEEARIVAVLHDVVEDTDVTLDDLIAMGFGESIVQAVDGVTHRCEEGYADYIVRAKTNSLSRQVKLADLEDNFNLPRTLFKHDRMARDLDRLRRYALSWQFLKGKLSGPKYREAMARIISVESPT